MTKLDDIRVRQTCRQRILGAGNKQEREDIAYLLDKLDACTQLIKGWREKVADDRTPWGAGWRTCARELEEILK